MIKFCVYYIGMLELERCHHVVNVFVCVCFACNKMSGSPLPDTTDQLPVAKILLQQLPKFNTLETRPWNNSVKNLSG